MDIPSGNNKNKYLNLVNGEPVYGFPFFVQIVALYLLK